MAHYVQVLNGIVVNMWDCAPKVPVGEDGWRDATMSLPVINDDTHYLGEWTYDLSNDVVVISREVHQYTVDERKLNMLALNESNFNKFFKYVSEYQNFYTPEEITQRRAIAANNKTNIQNANSHSELNNLVLQEIELF